MYWCDKCAKAGGTTGAVASRPAGMGTERAKMKTHIIRFLEGRVCDDCATKLIAALDEGIDRAAARGKS